MASFLPRSLLPTVANLTRRLRHPVVTIGAVVAGLLLVLRGGGVLQPLELFAYDRLVRWQPAAPPDPRLLVVEITEEDLRRYGWPLSDALIARVLSQLQAHNPSAIGLDIYRDRPQEEGYDELLAQFDAANIVAITNIGSPEAEGTPPPPGIDGERIGFNDIPLDPDGIVRRNLLFAKDFQGNNLPSFALQLATLYLRERGITARASDRRSDYLQFGQALFVPIDFHSGGYQTIDARGYQVILRYRGDRRISRRLDIDRVLQGKFDPSWIDGKVVLIGSSAPSLRDVFATPYSATQKVPGVLLHAQMASQIIEAALGERSLLWYGPEALELLWLVSWIAWGCTAAWYARHPVQLAATAVVSLAGLWGAGVGLLAVGGWIPVSLPAVGFVLAAGSTVTYRLLYNALHDPLTGLPNRTLFANRLRQSMEGSADRDSGCGVLFLDVDRFKAINDSLGHGAGDSLLQAIAERLQAILTPGELLARVGGDEFAISIESSLDVEAATRKAERVRRRLSTGFDIGGQEVFVSASIGVALGRKGDRRDLLRDAHTAMYRAKALGKARPEIFEATMHSDALARFELERDLRHSVGNLRTMVADEEDSDPTFSSLYETIDEEFRAYYQPLIDLQSGRIAGFEALMRWQHPQRGLVSPGQFIPIAEETGAIIPLGLWILEAACRQTHQWNERFGRPFTISVNLSGKQFAQPNLVECVETILDRTLLSRPCLKLEITESVVMDNVEATIDILVQMKNLRVRLGIDDFGTGYSSLSYLHRFPTHTLKVDRSFVSRMGEADENAAIVRTIITLAHTLGMDVIAEGVETQEQLEMLRSLGCEYGQGYFFAKPLPAREATQLLAEDRHW